MADEKDIADETKAGGKKKLMLIIIVAVVLLLGAGAAAFFLLGGEEEPEAEGDAAAEAAEVVVEEGDPVYHEFDPTFIVNLPPGGPAGMLQIAIQVMTRTPSVIETLKANDPMLRHHLINLLESQQSADLLTVEGKQALQAALAELLAKQLEELQVPGKINGVYFTQFVLQ